MNLYSVPLFIPYSAYMTFLDTFKTYSHFDTFISSSMVIPLYIFVNFMYLWFMFCVIVPFLYKSIIFVKNSLYR